MMDMGVWTPGAVLAAMLGGAIAGAGMALIHPMPLAHSWRRVLLHAAFIAWLGMLFFTGRIAVAVEGGDPLLPRLVTALLLWLVFSVATVPTGWMVYRLR